MVKDDTTYEKFEFSASFNVIASRRSRVVYLPSSKGQLCAVGANENVIIWNLRTKQQERVLCWEAEGGRPCVTRLAVQPGSPWLAAGYVDGSLRVFHWQTGALEVTLQGHRSAVTALDFSSPGLLVSGALDTTVIVWDVVAEAGLYRLKGHKAPITQVQLIPGKNVLISSSKDVTVKFWDLESHHCFLTLPDISTEVRNFVWLNEQRLLLTLSDLKGMEVEREKAEIIFWKVTFYDEEEGTGAGSPAKRRKPDFDPLAEGSPEDEVDLHILKCERVGQLPVSSRNMVGEPSGQYIACFNKKDLEVYKVRTEKEIKKKKKKDSNKRSHSEEAEGEVTKLLLRKMPSPEEFKAAAEVRSVDFYIENQQKAQVVCLCVNNSLQTFTVDHRTGLAPDSGLLLPGHRGEVAAVALTADSKCLLTVGSQQVKLWKRDDLQCIRTMQCKQASCGLFCLGNSYAVVGCLDGTLHVINTSSGEEESFQAHEGAIRSLCLSPKKDCVVSAGTDKIISIWKFAHEMKGKGKVLTLEPVRSYEMTYDIAVAKFSPRGKYLGVGIRDGGVNARIYRKPNLDEQAEEKKLKMVHKLYSHSLPLTCMDFSFDDELLVTGSMDKSIKIWGMDFADVHRSLLAEQDVITAVQFLPKTHLFFSAGQDGSLKQWDADSFQRIRTLQGHQEPVRGLAVCPQGLLLLSCSRDNSVRLWERTQEIFNLLEEREKEADKEDEDALVHEDEAVIPGETAGETALASKKTIESIKSTEKLREALDLYKSESEKMAAYRQELLTNKSARPPEQDVMLKYRGITALEYLRSVLMGIRANDLEEVLLSLPFSTVLELLPVLPRLYAVRREAERADKCACFLLRVHHNQLLACREMQPVLAELSTLQQSRCREDLDMGGFISAAADFLARKMEETEKVDIFQEFRPQLVRKKKRRAKKQ